MKLPDCVDLERLVIGYATAYRDHLDVMRTALTVDDFTLETHRRIWRCIASMYDAGKPIDTNTVYHEMVSHNEGQQDLLTYIAQASHGLPDIPEIMGYLDRLRAATLRRRAVLALNNMALRAADETEPWDQVSAGIGSLCAEIVQAGSNYTGPISTHEMIQKEGIDKLLAPRRHGSIALPWKRLDHALTGLSGGQMIVIMASTSRGKTSLALQIATGAALQGYAPVIWTLEMGRRALFNRAVTQLAGTYASKQLMSFEERLAVNEASIKIDENSIYLDSDARDVSGFVAGLRRVRARARLGLAVVDHLQLVRASRKPSRAHEVSENSRLLKLAAMDLDIPFVVLSQVDRASVKGDGEIGLYSAKESGDIENDADVVMWVQSGVEFSRDQDTPVLLHIGKQREGPAGFSIPMTFRPSSQSFMEVSE